LKFRLKNVRACGLRPVPLTLMEGATSKNSGSTSRLKRSLSDDTQPTLRSRNVSDNSTQQLIKLEALNIIPPSRDVLLPPSRNGFIRELDYSEENQGSSNFSSWIQNESIRSYSTQSNDRLNVRLNALKYIVESVNPTSVAPRVNQSIDEIDCDREFSSTRIIENDTGAFYRSQASPDSLQTHCEGILDTYGAGIRLGKSTENTGATPIAEVLNLSITSDAFTREPSVSESSRVEPDSASSLSSSAEHTRASFGTQEENFTGRNIFRNHLEEPSSMQTTQVPVRQIEGLDFVNVSSPEPNRIGPGGSPQIPAMIDGIRSHSSVQDEPFASRVSTIRNLHAEREHERELKKEFILQAFTGVPIVVATVIMITLYTLDVSGFGKNGCKSDYKLVIWTVVNMVRILLQLSALGVLFYKVADDLESANELLLRQNAEKARKYINLFSIWWMLVGVYFIVTFRACKSDYIYQFTFVFVFCESALIFLPLVVCLMMLPFICLCLPCFLRVLVQMQLAHTKGGNRDEIRKIRCVKFGETDLKELSHRYGFMISSKENYVYSALISKGMTADVPSVSMSTVYVRRLGFFHATDVTISIKSALMIGYF